MVHCGLEPVVWISCVGDGTGGAIRVQYRVLPLHNVTVPRLLVVLGVSSQRVLHSVRERIIWFSLQHMDIKFV